GTGINPAFTGESSDPSSLISFLDEHVGDNEPGGDDFTNRSWFPLFNDIFDRWDQVSGLRFVYEPNDNGLDIRGPFNPGELGVVADVRIGGHSIDGESGRNTLAYNYFPNNGDMVIDTDNISFYSNGNNNFLGLRNVLAHEFGHGMGIPHHESSNSRNLMEPLVDLSFDGAQIDDIAEAQRRYGDNFEENGGNDQFINASFLGDFNGDDLAVGVDANMGDSPIEVLPNQADFVSIDGITDVDFLEFSVDGLSDLTFTLDMVGPSYQRGPQGGTQTTYDLSSQSDLDLQILGSDGVTVLGSSALDGLNVTEMVQLQLDVGNYFARISGRDDAIQFYEFRVSGIAVPEPGALPLAGLALGWLMRRRRANG
ncbi:MAG: matrixin family metalloprotease, partial [Planctomycetota bacterium]